MQLESEVVIPTSKPGEVGKEFKKLIDNFQSERNKLLEAEELASKKLIEKLKEEDEKNILQMKQKNMIRVREDEKLAKIMQEEMKKVQLLYVLNKIMLFLNCIVLFGVYLFFVFLTLN